MNKELPRTEFLLRQAQKIESQILTWVKNKFPHADDYHVRITKKGKWAVKCTNDYPMQHGSGEDYVLSEQDFLEATTTQTKNK